MPKEIQTPPKKSSKSHPKAKTSRKLTSLQVILVLTSILSYTKCSDEGIRFSIPTFFKDPSQHLSQSPIIHPISADGSIDKVFTLKEGIHHLKLEDGEYRLQIEVQLRGSYFIIPSLHLDGMPPSYISKDKILEFYGQDSDIEGVRNFEKYLYLRKQFKGEG